MAQAYGVELGVEMCKQLLAAGTPGVHLYTLNTDKTALAILEALGMVDTKNPPKVSYKREKNQQAAQQPEVASA